MWRYPINAFCFTCENVVSSVNESNLWVTVATLIWFIVAFLEMATDYVTSKYTCYVTSNCLLSWLLSQLMLLCIQHKLDMLYSVYQAQILVSCNLKSWLSLFLELTQKKWVLLQIARDVLSSIKHRDATNLANNITTKLWYSVLMVLFAELIILKTFCTDFRCT